MEYIPEREGSLEDNIDCLRCLELSSFTYDDATTYAIGNELSESNEFRLDHLNKEASNALTKILHEFRGIQYREGENLTFSSTVYLLKNVIKTKHEDPIYRKPYEYHKPTTMKSNYKSKKSFNKASFGNRTHLIVTIAN